MMPSIAAGCAGKARLFEHKDVRVRAGARAARSAGQSSQPDVGETVMPGANGFGYFPRKESNPRRGTARKKTRMSRSDRQGCGEGNLVWSNPHARQQHRFAQIASTAEDARVGDVAQHHHPASVSPADAGHEFEAAADRVGTCAG